MKSPPPGCNGVEGCKWIPKKGCFDNVEEVILEKKNIKKSYSKDKSNKNMIPKKQKHKCRTYKKSKPLPGCERVDGCIWIPKIGCLENEEQVIKYEKEKKGVN
mgnify:FL=1